MISLPCLQKGPKFLFLIYEQNPRNSLIGMQIDNCRAGGRLFWFKFILTNFCYFVGVRPLLIKQLKSALPARMNKVEREFAGKNLVNSYGVVERFVENLFIASSSIIKNKKVMASNLIVVMSDVVENQLRGRYWFRHIKFGSTFSLFQYYSK